MQPISAAQDLCSQQREYGIGGAMDRELRDRLTLAFTLDHLNRHTGGAIMC